MRVKLLVLFANLLLGSSMAFAGHLLPEDALPHRIDELPLYGHVTKTPELRASDQSFISSVIKATGSAEDGSRGLLGKTWAALLAGKPNFAMRRANEAYLLNPKEGGVFWYMALIQETRGAPREEVEGLFRQALEVIDDAHRAKLEHDYDMFATHNDGLPYDNLSEIAAAYPAARDAVLAKWK